MTNYNLSISIKMSSDIELHKTSSMQISEKSKIQQDKQKFTTNLAAILSLLDVQICLEDDPEILAILTDQKTNLNEILIQKQSGKKGSFKAAEKEAKPVAKKTAKKDTPAKSDKPKKTAKGKK